MGSILAIGLMSDLSRGGIDAALIETDGHRQVRPIAHQFTPFVAGALDLLSQAGEIALDMERPDAHPVIAEAADIVTNLNLGAVDSLLRLTATSRTDIEIIGFHGHTVAHRPERGWSWQIGDGARLALMTGMDVVDDFRGADVSMGGQGAPLAAVYHRAITIGQRLPAMVLDMEPSVSLTLVAADGSLQAKCCDPVQDVADFVAETMTDFGIAPNIILVTGSGREKSTLLGALSAASGVNIVALDALGWNGDATDAEAMAYLAMRKLAMLPITFPGTTGAPYPMGGGTFHKGRMSEEDVLAKPRRKP